MKSDLPDALIDDLLDKEQSNEFRKKEIERLNKCKAWAGKIKNNRIRFAIGEGFQILNAENGDDPMPFEFVPSIENSLNENKELLMNRAIEIYESSMSFDVNESIKDPFEIYAEEIIKIVKEGSQS